VYRRGHVRSVLKSLIPARYQPRLRRWLQPNGTESNVHWLPYCDNREIEKFIRSLDCCHIDAWRSADGFTGNIQFPQLPDRQYPDYDVCQLPLDKEQFDLVIAEQVFEHVLRPDRAAANVYERLRPGGIFVISTPFLLKVHGAPLICIAGLRRECGNCWKLQALPSGRRPLGAIGMLIRDMTPGLDWTVYDPLLHSLDNQRNSPSLFGPSPKSENRNNGAIVRPCRKHYTKSFYEEIRTGRHDSAEVMLPLVCIFSRCTRVDVGWGDGSWLSIFRKLGRRGNTRIDGKYVDRNILQIPPGPLPGCRPNQTLWFESASSIWQSHWRSPSTSRPNPRRLSSPLSAASPPLSCSQPRFLSKGGTIISMRVPDKGAALFGNMATCGRFSFASASGRTRPWMVYAQNTLLFAKAIPGDNARSRSSLTKTNPTQLWLGSSRNYLEVPARQQLRGKSASRVLLVA